jgi:hypothetical protein
MEMSAPPEPTAPPQAERVNVPPTDGQWVYTAQYGWVWMPFGSQFLHVPPGGSPPLMFVFYPPVGWRWVGPGTDDASAATAALVPERPTGSKDHQRGRAP